jgi:hypothetical protein
MVIPDLIALAVLSLVAWPVIKDLTKKYAVTGV